MIKLCCTLKSQFHLIHNSITIYNFAVCNLKLNNYKLADEAINLALRHQPDNYEFLNLKGQILREMGRHDASEEFFIRLWI